MRTIKTMVEQELTDLEEVALLREHVSTRYRMGPQVVTRGDLVRITEDIQSPNYFPVGSLAVCMSAHPDSDGDIELVGLRPDARDDNSVLTSGHAKPSQVTLVSKSDEWFSKDPEFPVAEEEEKEEPTGQRRRLNINDA